ncbi:Putative secreted protein [Corynebacterium glyciniphilum AJ 3170]|uniref:Putative secreted protein n=1 Tax=Corynebacterium glyciniphilum AJ 3170 TaxID=1404245 RepID=X5DUY2_9CORY|nr:LppP/LprE family lipoprotein [Corynebacterium glyciniphilum]AHW65104.1 Putative secreted protein [Corynebacterium glyciniphilum AJ 3170]
MTTLMYMDTLRRHHVAAVAALGCTAVLLTGCTQQDETPTATETVMNTVTDTVEQTQAPDNGAPSETTAEPSGDATADACEEAAVDNPLTGEEPIPVRVAEEETPDIFFHYTATDDQTDPCAPLSWVVLNGGNGTAENSNGTAGSSRQTVALFAEGELVTEPAPILARRIESVDRIDDSTVRVNYAFFGDAPAAADQNVPGSATFHWDDSRIEVSDNTIPVELNESTETLDLDSVT